MTEARRPRWPWIAAVVIGVPVLYALSIPLIRRVIGPLYRHGWMTADSYAIAILQAYCGPAASVHRTAPPACQQWIEWYVTLIE